MDSRYYIHYRKYMKIHRFKLTNIVSIHRLTNEYNFYIHRLIDKYSILFFYYCLFRLPPQMGSLQNRHNINRLCISITIHNDSNWNELTRHNCSIIHKSHPDNSKDTTQTKTTLLRRWRRRCLQILLSSSRWCRWSRIPPRRRVVILSAERHKLTC
jgi:hypothetical protein